MTRHEDTKPHRPIDCDYQLLYYYVIGELRNILRITDPDSATFCLITSTMCEAQKLEKEFFND